MNKKKYVVIFAVMILAFIAGIIFNFSVQYFRAYAQNLPVVVGSEAPGYASGGMYCYLNTASGTIITSSQDGKTLYIYGYKNNFPTVTVYDSLKEISFIRKVTAAH